MLLLSTESPCLGEMEAMTQTPAAFLRGGSVRLVGGVDQRLRRRSSSKAGESAQGGGGLKALVKAISRWPGREEEPRRLDKARRDHWRGAGPMGWLDHDLAFGHGDGN